MRILALGDVVGDPGCDFIRKRLPSLKREKKIDVCIANGENSAPYNGVTSDSANNLFSSGVDFITTGNHVFQKKEVYDFLDERNDIIRPANFYSGNPGKGYGIIDKGSVRIGIINLLGQYGIDGGDNPFVAVDNALKEIDGCKIKIVDFHCEATSEKRAMGFYLQGRISAFFGTHTHVQTADEQILGDYTGYITDLGMCGSINSVLGIKPETVIKRLKEGLPEKFETAEGPCMINGCIFEVDNNTGKTVSVERIFIRE